VSNQDICLRNYSLGDLNKYLNLKWSEVYLYKSQKASTDVHRFP
jgi:hypothetical protein